VSYTQLHLPHSALLLERASACGCQLLGGGFSCFWPLAHSTANKRPWGRFPGVAPFCARMPECAPRTRGPTAQEGALGAWVQRVGMTSLGPTYFCCLVGNWAEFVLSHSHPVASCASIPTFSSLHPTRVATTLAFPSLEALNTPIQTCCYQYLPLSFFHFDARKPLRDRCPTNCEYLTAALRVTFWSRFRCIKLNLCANFDNQIAIHTVGPITLRLH
jgi:hypothetical protein